MIRVIDRCASILCAFSLVSNAAGMAAATYVGDPVSFFIAWGAAVISGLAWIFQRGRAAER